MKLTIVLCICALLLVQHPASGFRFRRFVRRAERFVRRVGRTVRDVATVVSIAGTIAGRKRAIEDLDTDKDFNINQQEAEALFERRDAEHILSLADLDGDSKVSLEEFARGLESLAAFDVDQEFKRAIEEEDEYE